jgi:hypothetical protein
LTAAHFERGNDEGNCLGFRTRPWIGDGAGISARHGVMSGKGGEQGWQAAVGRCQDIRIQQMHAAGEGGMRSESRDKNGKKLAGAAKNSYVQKCARGG